MSARGTTGAAASTLPPSTVDNENVRAGEYCDPPSYEAVMNSLRKPPPPYPVGGTSGMPRPETSLHRTATSGQTRPPYPTGNVIGMRVVHVPESIRLPRNASSGAPDTGLVPLNAAFSNIQIESQPQVHYGKPQYDARRCCWSCIVVFIIIGIIIITYVIIYYKMNFVKSS